MKVGDPIKTYYLNVPCPKELQYEVGQEVIIFDIDTKEELATFIVSTTNEKEVSGVINTVKND